MMDSMQAPNWLKMQTNFGPVFYHVSASITIFQKILLRDVILDQNVSPERQKTLAPQLS